MSTVYNIQGIYKPDSIGFAGDIQSMRTMMEDIGYSNAKDCIEVYVQLLFQPYDEDTFKIIKSFSTYCDEAKMYLGYTLAIVDFVENMPDCMAQVSPEVIYTTLPMLATVKESIDAGKKAVQEEWEYSCNSFIKKLRAMLPQQARMTQTLSDAVDGAIQAIGNADRITILTKIYHACSLRNDAKLAPLRAELFALSQELEPWMSRPYDVRIRSAFLSSMARDYEIPDILDMFYNKMLSRRGGQQ